MEKYLLILGAEHIGGGRYITPWTFPVNSNLKEKKNQSTGHCPWSVFLGPPVLSAEKRPKATCSDIYLRSGH